MTASSSARLPAQARAEFISAVNGTCGPLIHWIEFDGICRGADIDYNGTAACISQTDAQSDYLYGTAERLIKALPGTGWRTTFSAVRLIREGKQAVLDIRTEYRDEWKD